MFPGKLFLKLMLGPGTLFLVIKIPMDEGLFRLPWQPISAYFSTVVIIGAAAALLYRRLRRTTLLGLSVSNTIESEASLENVARRIRSLRRDRFHVSGTSTVFNCPTSDDRIWRNVITRLAPECDLVILDQTSLSENLIWELRTILSLISPSKLILLRRKAISNGESPNAIYNDIDAELEQILGDTKPLVLDVPSGKLSRMTFYLKHRDEVHLAWRSFARVLNDNS
jgi:hypothetical protein